jgi:DNA adenine methylase
MFKALQEGWLPPTTISETDYFNIKNSLTIAKETYGDKLPAVRGVVGFAYSYAAKWFGGYRRGATAYGTKRDYIREGYNNIVKQIPFIKGIRLYNSPYHQLLIPPNSIIYCDPPYRNTTKYKDLIDHDHFYQWCRDKKAEGHTIFISEYQMPDDFICIWSKPQTSSLTKDTGGKTALEKLFTL